MNYYNEIDSHAAQWLRNLINDNHIPAGLVDERSIEDVFPSDLRGFAQCHFFAGIGGWSLALELAGFPSDRPVWTGSCPCQPFSAAGKGVGTDDERHLWPAWHHLIKECKPQRIYGEQVEAAINHGWLDLVQSDLEAEGYAFGAVGLPAACVGAPHIRQRLWFMAYASSKRHIEQHGDNVQRGRAGDTEQIGLGGEFGDMGNATGERCGEAWTDSQRPRKWPTWSSAEYIPCQDGKARPIEPGTFPLADGVSGRVVKLRGYGNAIEPQVAAQVILATL